MFPTDASLKGHFFSGTVLTDVTEDMDIMKEEIFGPVLPIYRFKTEDEVCVHATLVPAYIHMCICAYVWMGDSVLAQFCFCGIVVARL